MCSLRLVTRCLVVAIKGIKEQIVQNQANQNQANQEQALESQETNSVVQRLAVIVIGLLLVSLATIWGLYAVYPTDPYVQSVLARTGDTSRGRDIFVMNCAVCHGLEATGEVGPDLRNVSERKSRAALIDQVISGKTPPMPQFQPGEKDMADLLSFLETL